MDKEAPKPPGVKMYLAFPTKVFVGVAAVGIIVLSASLYAYNSRQREESAIAYYVEGCALRVNAINERASRKQQPGRVVLPIDASSDYCSCQASALLDRFDVTMTRDLGDWFHSSTSNNSEKNPTNSFSLKSDLHGNNN